MRLSGLDAEQMALLDRLVVGEYHIDLVVMMEDAGRALASQVRRFLGSPLNHRKVLVMAGKGNNGGGGLVAARHLHNWGAHVEVASAYDPGSHREAPAKQMCILQAMNLPVHFYPNVGRIQEFDLIIDALLGYNQRGNPKDSVAELVEQANSSGKPIIALDIPTGLDPDTGTPNSPCIKATQTLTLAIPKKGLLVEDARPYVGRLFLADISVPKELYKRFGIDDELFQESSIIELEL